MRGTGLQTLFGLLVVAVLILALAIYTQTRAVTVKIQQAAPQPQPQVQQVAGEVNVPQWNLLVVLQDTEGNPVYDANVWLLTKAPADIYKTPTSDIYRVVTDANQTAEFDNVLTGKEYYILAAAPGYYNAGKDINIPSRISKTLVDNKLPISTTIVMSKKGTILGVQVPLEYRGSTADIAKLVYNSDHDDYETQYQWVVSSTGEVRYKKILVELNTDALTYFDADLNTNVTATIDKLTITIGNQTFDLSDIASTGSKTIEFDSEQVAPAGSTIPVEIYVEGTNFSGVSGKLLTLTLYDVQSGEYTATVEGPA